MSRLYISAAHKSSGKTTVSIGLCHALRQRGMKVQPFKKGPDYIDPLWLASASGLVKKSSQYSSGKLQGCHNLDFNTMSQQEILCNLAANSQHADISLIEGNMGLYDGVAVDGSNSNAAMAKLTKTPVVLVIDSRGMSRGVAPLLLGLQQFDPKVHIRGVILNSVKGSRHEQKLRAVTETYTDIPVLGAIRNNPELVLDERHLGLMPSNEAPGATEKIAKIGKIIDESVDLDALLQIADSADNIDIDCDQQVSTDTNHERIRLGICDDSAFGFYYTGDKQVLIDAGADLVPINTLTDPCLPENLDGLFIGGGFPETQMQDLEANSSMRQSIHTAIENGLPTYAECGGLMYLSRNLHWNGKSAAMVGIIPADTEMHTRPQGRGYVRLEETSKMPWPQTDTMAQSDSLKKSVALNAHEFHYSRLTGLPSDGQYAFKVLRGTGITGNEDGWLYKNLLANYSHLRHTSQYQWAQRFIDFIKLKKDS